MTVAFSKILYILNAERKILWSLLIRVGSAILLVASSIVLARVLGIEGYGIYSFVLAFASVLQLPATAGAYTLVVRETAMAMGRADYNRVRGLWRWSGRLVINLSALVVTLSVLALFLLSDDLTPDRSNALYFAILVVPVMSLIRLYSARLRGLGLIISSQVPEQLIQPTILLILVAVFGALYGGFSSAFATLLYLMTAAGVLLVLVWRFTRVRPPEISGSKEVAVDRASWRRSLIPLTLLSGLQIVSIQAGFLVLGGLGMVEGVAELKLATSIAVAGTFASQMIPFVFGPEFATAYAVRDKLMLLSLARRSIALSIITSLPPLMVLAVFSEPIILMAYGEEFLGASAPVLVLASAYVVVTMLGACSMILTMAGKERFAVRGHVVGAIFNMLLLFTFGASFGSAGAAVAAAIGMVVTHLYMLFHVIRIFRFDPSVFGLVKHLWSTMIRPRIVRA